MLQSLLLLGTKPVNALEEALMAFLKGKGDIETFLATLVDARVFVLVKGSGEQPPEHIQPLVLDGKDGGPAVCIFTSPDRWAVRLLGNGNHSGASAWTARIVDLNFWAIAFAIFRAVVPHSLKSTPTSIRPG